MTKNLTLAIVFLLHCLWLQAQDTFSIVAVDSVTGEVGSAGATCLQAPNPPMGALIISDIIPGLGAIHTQAQWNSNNQQYARQMLADEGRTPQQTLDQLLLDDDQSNPSIRQYGIAAFLPGGQPSVAAFTGANCFDYKSHIIGPNYAIQGNILLGQEILDSMETRFLHTQGSMADKLMASLQGANVPGADSRCLSEGVPALSAFVRVARPGDVAGSLYLDLSVKSRPTGMSPIDSLQTLFDEWKTQQPNGVAVVAMERFEVFPNPANLEFRIRFADGGRHMVQVSDLCGRTIEELSVGVQGVVNCSAWPKGVYLLRSGNWVRRVVKQ